MTSQTVEPLDTRVQHGPCAECWGSGDTLPGEPDCDFPYGTPPEACAWCDGTGIHQGV